MRKTILVTAATAMTVVALAGCNGKAASHAAKAKASASALATNSAIMMDKATAKADVTKCVSQVGILHIAAHPKLGAEAVVACLKKDAASPAVFQARAQALIQANGYGKGALAKDEVGLAGLLVKP